MKWTRKTTETIADLLEQIDIPVSANTVARLLHQMDFSLRVNRKQIATNSSPYQDRQCQHISWLRARFLRQGLPIISVDSKKRELIGNFKNSGAKWDRSPVPVKDHDFRSDASGVGISYGIYDPPNNRGTVCVGISHDTPAFAAHSHRHLVETRGIVSLWPCSQAPGSGRFGWQQRLQLMGLEDRTPGSVVQPIWHHCDHRALPYGRFQMESHRASPVFRDLQTLGRRATGQL